MNGLNETCPETRTMIWTLLKSEQTIKLADMIWQHVGKKSEST